MDHLQQDGQEEIMYKGKLFEIIKQPMKAGDKKVSFEIARRPPGTRLIIVDGKKMLIAKEYRTELNGYDYRLPGGKVFNTLEEYLKNNSEDILPFAIEAAKRECREEVGLIPENIKHFTTAKAGATVIWDLFYFIVDDFIENERGQELEPGEVVTCEWKTFEEVKELCKEGKIMEDRTLGVLYKFFLQYPEQYS